MTSWLSVERGAEERRPERERLHDVEVGAPRRAGHRELRLGADALAARDRLEPHQSSGLAHRAEPGLEGGARRRRRRPR